MQPTPESTMPSTTATSTASAAVGPNEEWIAFQWGGEATIFLIRPDGSGLHELQRDLAGEEVHPTWSPGGQRVAFIRISPGGTEELWLVDADGTDPGMLFSCADACTSVRLPDWSADGGTWIYYTLEWAGPNAQGEMTLQRTAIGRTEVATRAHEILLEAVPPKTVEQVRVSPDGTRLAYIRFQLDGEAAQSALFVSALDGSDEQQVTDWGLTAFHPDWISDDRLVFDSYGATFGVFDPDAPLDVAFNLHAVDANGGHLMPLTQFEPGGSRAAQARVTPDGLGVVFTRLEPPDWETRRLAYVNVDGSRLRWLTPAPTDGTHPQVRPTLDD